MINRISIKTLCIFLFISIGLIGVGQNFDRKQNDTLRNSNHKYYFADKSPREFGELIMKDSVSPSDNYSTFRVIDSLKAKSVEDRKFYFKVFLKIMEKSDGALAEAIGSPAYDYVEKYSFDFFELSKTITNAQFELWANNVGVEIFLSSKNPNKEAKDFFNKLKKKCSKEQIVDVDRFYKMVNRAIVDNDKN